MYFSLHLNEALYFTLYQQDAPYFSLQLKRVMYFSLHLNEASHLSLELNASRINLPQMIILIVVRHNYFLLKFLTLVNIYNIYHAGRRPTKQEKVSKKRQSQMYLLSCS